ncbi:FAD-dependent oxidoreductase [Georgenia ruanii]|uniref:ferredoxin--NADP(+) reductase n=1 Tax=Georgenia ruanii TaxID=348442 RepID=A0A7J9UV25_9MICO|nr:FAD-dependent oxidoreductase [Georgenia ruanii]MPV88466.1 ferredoxin [Georgenia ruanii]
MTYVITQNCCNDASCVAVCPVNCIHPTPDEPGYKTAEMLYIDPDVCIDCGACLDACPVSAIEPDFDLPSDLLPYIDLNAQYYRHPTHLGYPQVPAKAGRPSREWPGSEQLRVAIVGSGPAASYAAEELLSQRGLTVHVDMFERLTAPWGLVRFGVAPDHQETKATADDFARTARRKNFRLFLDVEVGKTLTHDDLAARYHAVIYAVGAMGDRQLGIPGEDLPGSHSATEFVAWYNGHPDYADRTFDLSGERAVVIGNGNVALDVARVLLSDVDDLRRTDIADHALEQLAASRIREVVVVGRRGPAQAAFTTPELLGLAGTTGLDIQVAPDEVSIDEATRQWSVGREESMALYKARMIAELGSATPTASRRASLRFLLSPTEIIGDERVEGVRFMRNSQTFEDGAVVAHAAERAEELSCGLVLRSVGYRGAAMPGLPFDESRAVLPNVGGRVVQAVGSHEPVNGVYATGWIKRGPSGVIGTNKQCAKETVDALLEDWVNGSLFVSAPDRDVIDLIPDHLDLAGWNAIDDHERRTGRPLSRPRVKLVKRAEMLRVAAAAATAAAAAAAGSNA